SRPVLVVAGGDEDVLHAAVPLGGEADVPATVPVVPDLDQGGLGVVVKLTRKAGAIDRDRRPDRAEELEDQEAHGAPDGGVPPARRRPQGERHRRKSSRGPSGQAVNALSIYLEP